MDRNEFTANRQLGSRHNVIEMYRPSQRAEADRILASACISAIDAHFEATFGDTYDPRNHVGKNA